jgi:hypothetical protein
MHGAGARRFGTFGGVFTPAFLGILGLIMFLRSGYIVGAGGLHWALLMLLLALCIACAGLSISTSDHSPSASAASTSDLTLARSGLRSALA